MRMSLASQVIVCFLQLPVTEARGIPPGTMSLSGDWTQADSDSVTVVVDFKGWTERKRIQKLRYMHRNPVKRGLVESPELGAGAASAPTFSAKQVERVNEWEVLKMKMPRPAA
jgi:hypothetical protein